jgi:hypothetical protein
LRPRLLDLFSGAGGAGKGYADAGFEVVGVDHVPQPNYPFEFHQADALTFPLDGFDAIHASPPCPVHSSLNGWSGDSTEPDLVPQTRELLRATGLPYVIENIVGAPLEQPVMLCGQALGLRVRRHRLFETNFPVMVPQCQHPEPPVIVVGGSNRPQGVRPSPQGHRSVVRGGEGGHGDAVGDPREGGRQRDPTSVRGVHRRLLDGRGPHGAGRMKRSALNRDPEKLREFQQRGRESSVRSLQANSKPSTLGKGPARAKSSFAASPAQRAKIIRLPFCIVCRRDATEWLSIDPAHLCDRSLGGCDHEDCVVGLCRDGQGGGCHRAFDKGELDLLPYLEPSYRREAAHAVLHLGLAGAVRRLSNDRTGPG